MCDTHLQSAQVWHVLTRDYTVLPATHTFIHMHHPALRMVGASRLSLFGTIQTRFRIRSSFQLSIRLFISSCQSIVSFSRHSSYLSSFSSGFPGRSNEAFRQRLSSPLSAVLYNIDTASHPPLSYVPAICHSSDCYRYITDILFNTCIFHFSPISLFISHPRDIFTDGQINFTVAINIRPHLFCRSRIN